MPGINAYIGLASIPSSGGGGGGTIATSPQSSVTLAAPSGTANDITFTFDQAYEVGEFPNGDPFVLPDTPGGTVTVQSITPAYSSGRNGHMVNPKATVWNAGQSFDDRGSDDSAFTAPVSLPLDLSDGESLVKVVSMATQSSYSWIQHAGVLTVLDAAPPTGTMRPAAFGTDKRLISSANITAALFPSLDATACPSRISVTEARARTAPFRNDYHPGPSWGYYRASTDAVVAGKTWGGDVLERDVETLCALCLDHLTGAEKVEVAINLAQHGIDTWGVSVPATGGGAGFLRGGGANGAGHLLLLAFAAWATDDTELKAFLADASDATWNPVGGADIGFPELLFWETASFYRNSAAKGSVALWGKKWETWIGDNEAKYWSEFNIPTGSGVVNSTLRDPYEYIDGGPIPGDSYQGNSSHQILGLAAIFDQLPGLKTVWPSLVDNANVLHDYGHRWASHGIWTLPDPVAPKSGTYGVDYGPDGSGGFIAGSGRAPSLDSTGAHSGNRFSDFTDEFYLAYATGG